MLSNQRPPTQSPAPIGNSTHSFFSYSSYKSISSPSVKWKTDICYECVGPDHCSFKSLLRSSRNFPAKTSVNKHPDRHCLSGKKTLELSTQCAVDVGFELGVGKQECYQTDLIIIFKRSRMVDRLIVSKALDIWILIRWFFHLFLWTTDNITRWHHTLCAHDLPSL